MLSAGQFFDWIKQYDREPWGERRNDQRAQANTLWRLLPYMSKNAGITHPSFSYPYFEDDEAEQITPEQMAYLEEYDNALESLGPGKGYRLTKSIEEIEQAAKRRVNHDNNGRTPNHSDRS